MKKENTTRIKVSGTKTSIGTLYDVIAVAMNLPVNDDARYDCSKVNVAKNIQENVFEYYKDSGMNEESVCMLWLCYGPKAVDYLADDEVELKEGWYKES